MKKSDVKESLTKQVELHEDEKEELVSVEMTPEQRDRIVKILADEKLKAKADEERPKYKMDLLWAHHINGVKYGPGRNVIVPEGIHATIQWAEIQQRDQEINLNSSKTRSFQILQSGHSIPQKVQ